MRVVPLKKEARRVARLRGSRLFEADFGRWALLIAIYFIVVFITATFYLRPSPGMDDNRRLTFTPVIAQADFSFIRESTRAEWERERERRHNRVWAYNADAGVQVVRAFSDLVRAAEALDPAAPPAELAAALRRQDARLGVTEANAPLFVRSLQDRRFSDAMRELLRQAYDDYLVVDQVERLQAHLKDDVFQLANPGKVPLRTRTELLSNLLPYPVDPFAWNPLLARQLYTYFNRQATLADVQGVAEAILAAIVRPSLALDETATRQALETYSMRNLHTFFEQGQELFTRNDALRPLTVEEERLLLAHNAALAGDQQKRLLGHMAFVFLIFTLLGFYVRKFNRHEAFTSGSVILISLPIMLGLAVQAFCIVLAGGDAQTVGYLFPAGAIGMLGVLLLDVRMALLLVTWGCLLMGLQVDMQHEYVIVGLFGGYAGVAALYTIRKRWEVFVASLLIAAVNATTILLNAFIVDPNSELPLSAAGLGFINGVCSFLVLAVLPLFERFGIVTDLQLLELTGLQHPLLRDLEEKAPGTWQHTLNVAKLAEAAASRIGVNYLLVRAGCYYHDIGKMAKPEYFTENQITSEDKMRHAELKPQISSFIIKNHVKQGIEMAHEHNIPERIIDFIRQHHGTSAISFFYHKALEQQARGEIKDQVRIEDYRYPGPKPQTIEAAIVMLADSVEATATAKLSNRTVREDDIQQVVRTTVFEKFNDGQFDECNLTLRDLNIIRETFVETLKSRFHTRIDYPKKTAAPAAPAPPATPAPPQPRRDSGSKRVEKDGIVPVNFSQTNVQVGQVMLNPAPPSPASPPPQQT